MSTWWRALPRREQALLALAALAFAAALLVRPVACLVSTDYALAVTCPVTPADLEEWTEPALDPDRPAVSAVVPGGPVDPWGRPWRYEWQARPAVSLGSTVFLSVYSAGPDGQDDAAADDDLVMSSDSTLALQDERARRGGALVAALLVWLWACVRAAFAPRAAHALVEAGRAVVLASLPAACAAPVVFARERDLAPLVGLVDAQRLFVPLPVAVASTLAFLLWLAALRLRLRRPSPTDASTVVAWRGPLLIVVVAVGLLLPAGLWLHHERSTFQRARLLALACMGHPARMDELAAGDDLDLVRAFARQAPPDLVLAHRPDAFYAGLARLGPDAAPLLARALEDTGPAFSPSVSQSEWRHLRACDPTLDVLFARVAARPDAYVEVTYVHPTLVASRVGRRAVATSLLPFLDDPGETGSRVNGYDLRLCDEVVDRLSRLFDEPRPFAAPAKADMSTEAWDAAVAKAQAWAQGGASFGSPVSWVVVGGPRRERTPVVVTWNGGAGRAASSGSMVEQFLVIEPAELKGARLLNVAGAANARAVDVPITPRAGETTWVRVDLSTGTVETRVYLVPD